MTKSEIVHVFSGCKYIYRPPNTTYTEYFLALGLYQTVIEFSHKLGTPEIEGNILKIAGEYLL